MGAADLLSSRRVRVRGSSMEPTLQDGDLVLVSRAAYVRQAPQRGEIVLVRWPADGPEYLKRIVGLPGEEVRVERGRVLIDGVPLVEPSLAPLGSDAAVRDGLWILGEDAYFLLGDNRADSLDSRAWGPVSRRWIRGRAWYRYGPRARSGLLPPVLDR
ncbi:MAG: signal peptidase I [Chloroflexi bacterium]|nr:signal peptidase I [Chloroflexota bacterium]